MSKIKDGGPAFPSDMGDPRSLYSGMMLRDYFAIHCDQPGATEITHAAGLTYRNGHVWLNENESCGSFHSWYDSLPADDRYRLYAKVRYELADAMLAARDGRT